DASELVFGETERLVAGEPVQSRQAGENGMLSIRVIDSEQSATGSSDPHATALIDQQVRYLTCRQAVFFGELLKLTVLVANQSTEVVSEPHLTMSVFRK